MPKLIGFYLAYNLYSSVWWFLKIYQDFICFWRHSDLFCISLWRSSVSGLIQMCSCLSFLWSTPYLSYWRLYLAVCLEIWLTTGSKIQQAIIALASEGSTLMESVRIHLSSTLFKRELKKYLMKTSNLKIASMNNPEPQLDSLAGVCLMKTKAPISLNSRKIKLWHLWKYQPGTKLNMI